MSGEGHHTRPALQHIRSSLGECRHGGCRADGDTDEEPNPEKDCSGQQRSFRELHERVALSIRRSPLIARLTTNASQDFDQGRLRMLMCCFSNKGRNTR